MSARDDGGPAFPTSRRVAENYMDEGGYGRTRTVTVAVGGLSLRDWFAGQALAGQLSDPTTDGDPTSRALWAYKYADAMLKERAK